MRDNKVKRAVHNLSSFAVREPNVGLTTSGTSRLGCQLSLERKLCNKCISSHFCIGPPTQASLSEPSEYTTSVSLRCYVYRPYHGVHSPLLRPGLKVLPVLRVCPQPSLLLLATPVVPGAWSLTALALPTPSTI